MCYRDSRSLKAIRCTLNFKKVNSRMKNTPRPMCFVAMPFGKRAPPGKKKPVINFDLIYEQIEKAVVAEGLECIRADFETGGGFIHKPMYERLLVAEYVVADLTFSNPNVTYEVGVRHGASARPTILVGAEGLLGVLPFDFRPLRVFCYKPNKRGQLGKKRAAAFVEGLRQRLQAATQGSQPTDNPIMQVTSWNPGGNLEHDKTDVFLERLEYATEYGKRIKKAAGKASRGKSIQALSAIAAELLERKEVLPDFHSALLGVFLGFRGQKAYRQMADLWGQFPQDLRSTPVAREQYALGLNRLAEEAAQKAQGAEKEAQARKHRDRAIELRREAVEALDDIPSNQASSETWGIRGRIYKGAYQAAESSGDSASALAMLQRAIEAYEQGMRADMRDYFPGVNAVTLRLTRGTKADLSELEGLLPVVRMAVRFAPEARSEEERYWQAATELELASASRDFEAAGNHLTKLLGIDFEPWMRETTAKNLELQKKAFADDLKSVQSIEKLIEALPM